MEDRRIEMEMFLTRRSILVEKGDFWSRFREKVLLKVRGMERLQKLWRKLKPSEEEDAAIELQTQRRKIFDRKRWTDRVIGKLIV